MAAGYRSAQGKTVDMSVLSKQNEQVRAVGNMSVNARGDLVDSNNQVIQNRNASVAGQYNRTVNNVVAKQYKPTPAQQTIEPDLSAEEKAMFEELDDPTIEPETVVETKAKKK
jgi:hypothetical protein